jgi:hypothetical protein
VGIVLSLQFAIVKFVAFAKQQVAKEALEIPRYPILAATLSASSTLSGIIGSRCDLLMVRTVCHLNFYKCTPNLPHLKGRNFIRLFVLRNLLPTTA